MPPGWSSRAATGRHGGSRRARRRRRQWHAPGPRGTGTSRPTGRRAGRPARAHCGRAGGESTAMSARTIAARTWLRAALWDDHARTPRRRRAAPGRARTARRPPVRCGPPRSAARRSGAVRRGAQVVGGALALEQGPRSRCEHLVVVVDGQRTERRTRGGSRGVPHQPEALLHRGEEPAVDGGAPGCTGDDARAPVGSCLHEGRHRAFEPVLAVPRVGRRRALRRRGAHPAAPRGDASPAPPGGTAARPGTRAARGSRPSPVGAPGWWRGSR